MNDVARASGVSLKSVSRVINDEVGASPETRERVLAAARRIFADDLVDAGEVG
jgi:Transcriptional regulators